MPKSLIFDYGFTPCCVDFVANAWIIRPGFILMDEVSGDGPDTWSADGIMTITMRDGSTRHSERLCPFCGKQFYMTFTRRGVGG